MDYYIQLLKKGCFTREEVAGITGNLRTADSLLYSYKKKKYIESVRRNLYVALSPETGGPVCNPYEIASKIFNDAYISHHSAFEFYGMANQVFSEITVCSHSRFLPFEYDGKTYLYSGTGINIGIESVGKVRVSDLERTIVDNVKDFTRYGGLEELLHCLSMVTYVDEKKLLVYMEAYNNQFLYQKAGYILSLFPDMKISPIFFEQCKKRIQKSVRYLYEDLRTEKSSFIREWKLYVPENIKDLLREGGESFV